ncbi:MAG: serine/threonine-protein kinase [Phormidesmis sp.]
MATSFPNFTVTECLSDRYEILQPIGQPFGCHQVLAKDIQQQRSVVIKSLALGANTPAEDIGCFEREIQLLKLLDHPTIPRYIDSFPLETPKGKVMVLVQAHRGSRILVLPKADGALPTYPESALKEIAKQLLQGLVYLHGKGLVHRDIKPSNIAMVRHGEPLGQVSWLNFGSVQYVQAQRKDVLVGTYGYMPPEQVGGQATFASDLYSLGATLIYLAVGRHLGDLPRHGSNIQFDCPATQLSASFQQWLNWLIEPYVGDRPASAKQALAALNHLPLAMLKRRLVQPTRAQMLPVPISTSSRDRYEPFFTQIRSTQKSRSLQLVIPPVGWDSVQAKRSLAPLLMGSALLAVSLYLLTRLNFSLDRLVTVQGMATLAAASLSVMGCLYSARFLRSGLYLLGIALLRQIQIQLEADVLLIGYKYWLRSPDYVINTRRTDIYNISALPDGGALRILTHRNRTRTLCDCYKLTLGDGALSPRDIRWLTSLLDDWRRPAADGTGS